MALSNKAQLHALAGRDAEATVVAERAIALGRDAPAILSHALNNLGLARSRLGDAAALATFEESLRVALAANEPEHACRAYINLIWHDMTQLRLDDAKRRVAEGIEFAERSEFLCTRDTCRWRRGRLSFASGDWDEVVPAAASALDSSPPVRCACVDR